MRFSNRSRSHQSSLGFYITSSTYRGDHGLSLRLRGLEPGYNNLAMKRNIVVHAADYISDEYPTTNKFMGRSYGCPAVPAAEAKQIINCIKDGSCFFNYYPDKRYTQLSKILNADFIWPAVQASLLAATHSSGDTLPGITIPVYPVN